MSIFDKINTIARDHRIFGAQYNTELSGDQLEGLAECLPSIRGVNVLEGGDMGAIRETLGLDDKAFVDVVDPMLSDIQDLGVHGDTFVMYSHAAVEIAAQNPTREYGQVEVWRGFPYAVQLAVPDSLDMKEMDWDNGKPGGYSRPDMLGIDWAFIEAQTERNKIKARAAHWRAMAKQFPKEVGIIRPVLAMLKTRFNAIDTTCYFGAGYPSELDTSAAPKPRVMAVTPIRNNDTILPHFLRSNGQEVTVDTTQRPAEPGKAPEYSPWKYTNFANCVEITAAHLNGEALRKTDSTHRALSVLQVASEVFAGRRERAVMKYAAHIWPNHKPEPAPLAASPYQLAKWEEEAARAKEHCYSIAAHKLRTL